MFIGEFTHSIDDKGRVIMPSKFREILGDKFYVTKGMEGCVFVYEESEWNRLEEKTRQLKLTSKKAREFARLFYAPAREVEFDKQGRFVIPQNLRDFAKIKKEATIIGVSTRIEIWDKDIYKEYIDGSNMDYDKVFEDFDDLDI
ncbi:MAG: division/cell wall cluster transcriptional repressor MraZ [Tissierellia bacterium]|nr:division/cell wall cluster transcriptional repressor MraZ [Tissierellia bacterium]